MLIFQGISSSRAIRRPRAVTIGVFDGVHRGHQVLIRRCVEIAREQGITSTVVAFEPHPRAFFRPLEAPGRIQGMRDRARALASLGVDELRILRFRRSLAEMTPQHFMQRFLHEELQTRHLVVGDDFRFGARRQGSFETLMQAAEQFGWTTQRIQTVAEGGERISSSALRDALQSGDLDRVRRMIGRPYTLSGHVIHGRKLGRELGMATLNIPVHRQLLACGIFAVTVEGLASTPLPGVASLGRRPTVEDAGRLLLEVHLFDWSGDAYGKLVNVTLVQRLRDEIRYDKLDDMIAQIHIDAAQARDYLSRHDL
jgi:riboflavin kinase/FMN adenylyltransferase